MINAAWTSSASTANIASALTAKVCGSVPFAATRFAVPQNVPSCAPYVRKRSAEDMNVLVVLQAGAVAAKRHSVAIAD